jgi:Tfp pilus assembly protein FimT
MVVLVIVGVLTAIAIPQMLAQRRLMRSTAVTHEILVQMRYARQMAMSQAGAWPLKPLATDPLRRVAYTFQYDDTTKEIKIWGPIPSGTAGVLNGSYPQNGGLTKPVVWDPLTQGGLTSAEIAYGIPTTSTGLLAGAPTIPVGALDDGVIPTALDGNNKINITFQPDGSVIDGAGVPANRAMVIFNKSAAQGTASAISVIGASGRVKVWRYSLGGNKYIE